MQTEITRESPMAGLKISPRATHILTFKNHALAENYLDVFQKVSEIFM